MSRILIAWEFGRNFGHLARGLPLARAWRDAGHEVAWAVPNLREAARQLAGEGFRLLQSPLIRPVNRQQSSPLNFADMLLKEGYDDTPALQGALEGWVSLLALAAPDAILYDYAPSALLAARVTGVPALVAGAAFAAPPRVSPLPAFWPGEAIPPATLQAAETTLVDGINRCLASLGGAPLASLGDLYGASTPYFTTFEELDPFGPRPGARYVGPVFALGDQAVVDWAGTGARRIFVYLRPEVPGCETLLEALQAANADIVCAMPGLPPAWRARFDRVRFHAGAVDVDRLLASADLCILSGSGTIATSLLAGVPVLVVPHFVEQYLAGLRVAAFGAGLTMRERPTTLGFVALLERLLSQPGFRAAARAFAARHADYDRQRACGQLVDAMAALLAPAASAAVSR